MYRRRKTFRRRAGRYRRRRFGRSIRRFRRRYGRLKRRFARYRKGPRVAKKTSVANFKASKQYLFPAKLVRWFNVVYDRYNALSEFVRTDYPGTSSTYYMYMNSVRVNGLNSFSNGTISSWPPAGWQTIEKMYNNYRAYKFKASLRVTFCAKTPISVGPDTYFICTYWGYSGISPWGTLFTPTTGNLSPEYLINIARLNPLLSVKRVVINNYVKNNNYKVSTSISLKTLIGINPPFPFNGLPDGARTPYDALIGADPTENIVLHYLILRQRPGEPLFNLWIEASKATKVLFWGRRVFGKTDNSLATMV